MDVRRTFLDTSPWESLPCNAMRHLLLLNADGGERLQSGDPLDDVGIPDTARFRQLHDPACMITPDTYQIRSSPLSGDSACRPCGRGSAKGGPWGTSMSRELVFVRPPWFSGISPFTNFSPMLFFGLIVAPFVTHL